MEIPIIFMVTNTIFRQIKAILKLRENVRMFGVW